MDILLTESQYKKLLVEKKSDKIDLNLSKNKNIVKSILNDVKEKHNIDFTAAATWGFVIGGFIGPVSDYIKGLYTNLSDSDVTLICFGIILTFFSSNKEKLLEVLQLIKEKKLISFFDRSISKAYDLKDAFFNFLESLNITFSKTSNMLAYCFLIPIIPTIKDLASLDLDSEEVSLVLKSLTHYTGTIVSSTILTQIFEKMIERFKS